MTFRTAFAVAALILSLGSPAMADTIEARMLNRGQSGSMVFEPDYVELQPGDAIKFRVGHKSHNAASIDGMVPEGYAGFKGKINEEIEVPFEQSGYYGIKCSPHYGMGMVMIVRVGDAEMSEAFRSFEAPARARQRFDDILARVASEAKGE